MTWQQWALVVWFCLAALTVVAQIGRPREPVTNGQAMLSLIFLGTLVALVVSI